MSMLGLVLITHFWVLMNFSFSAKKKKGINSWIIFTIFFMSSTIESHRSL